jgi:hypothetical protein
LALTRVAAHEPLGTALCGGFSSLRPSAPGGGFVPAPWPPGTTGRVVLTVSNVNQIQDDTWDFKLFGVTICTYDGGGQTTLSFSADIPSGLVLELTATNTQDNGRGNYFTVTVTVDGVQVLSTDAVNGTPGDTVTVGTFNT